MSEQLSPRQKQLALAEELRGTVCQCGGRKKSRETFCRSCYKLLPRAARRALYSRIGSGYEEAYASALDCLAVARHHDEPRREGATVPKAPVMRIPDPGDSWAQVELYRWQHGELPGEDGKKEKALSVPAGLRGMAAAITKGDRENFPTPFNVVSVLEYAAKLIEGKGGQES